MKSICTSMCVSRVWAKSNVLKLSNQASIKGVFVHSPKDLMTQYTKKLSCVIVTTASVISNRQHPYFWVTLEDAIDASFKYATVLVNFFCFWDQLHNPSQIYGVLILMFLSLSSQHLVEVGQVLNCPNSFSNPCETRGSDKAKCN